ncbi:MAG: NADP-dependent oxidoreductase [Desulfobacterales bacterium]|nr:NADP-dependent oxidoreductase [Desulfobacterales bacterium]
MKAFVMKKYGTIADIEQIHCVEPALGHGMVRASVRAAAINPADLKVISGKDGGRFIHSARPPIGIGYDFSGVIQETGAGVSRFVPGDEVFGFLPYSRKTIQGSFADCVVVKSDTIAKKPASVSHVEAATAATAASTALQALVDIGRIAAGQKVLINGASGGVGSYALQIAKGLGAEVWGTCGSAGLDYIRSLGADHVLDYRKENIEDLFEKFDIVFDVVSNASLGRLTGILAPKGVYVTLLPSLGLVTGKIRSLFSSQKCEVCIVQPRTADLEKIADMIDGKELATPVAEVYPVSDLKTALQRLAESGVRGKIGIIVND